ncbi:hypothetical protein HYU19_04890 [Candidatus Woesearchaeota archaeon]|nr:hypothetical protein [Candidatus Woesearchaeota archaeon]
MTSTAAPVVFAQQPAGEYDYSDPAAYQQEGFYANSDPLQWELSRVDWDQVDYTDARIYELNNIFSMPEPYQHDGFYQNLPDSGYRDLDYTKVDYDAASLHHDKIDGRKYVNDLGCHDCILAVFEGSAAYSYSISGVTIMNGDSVSIPGTYPSGTEFHVLGKKIKILFPDGVTEITIPAGDEITVDTARKVVKEKEGKSVSVWKDREMQYQGNTIEGQISFKNGQVYIQPGDSATVNHVTISHVAAVGGLNLYFDGERHEGAAISMDVERRKMYFGQGLTSGFSLSFLPTNVFLDAEEDDYLQMSPGYNSEITIQHRGEDLIPLVSVRKGNHGIDVRIINGEDISLVEDGSTFLYFGRLISNEEKNSVPFTMLLQDEAGNNLLGTGAEKEKIVFDNANNYVIVPESFAEEEIECKACAADVGESEALYELAKVSFREHSSIRSITVTDANYHVAYLMSRMLDDLPPAVRESVLELEIVPDGMLSERCGKGASGCSFLGMNRIIVGDHVSPATFYHELAHTLTYTIEQREAVEAEWQLKEYQLELERKYNAGFTPQVVYQDHDGIRTYLTPCDGCTFSHIYFGKQSLTSEDAEIIQQFAESSLREREQSFTARWAAIAGDVYGKDLTKDPDMVEPLPAAWADEQVGPRNGCVRAYGCNNAHEDIATFVEPIAEGDYDFYKPLITPGSSQYDKRYKDKLDLLHEYGFISNEDYRKITGG